MDGARIRAAAYLRRSTDHQDQSLGDQQAAIERYAAAQGFELVAAYVDDAISGTSVAGRSAFLNMIDDAAAAPRPFDRVLVYDVKRFGRMDNDETGYYRHLLRLRGVQVHYTSEQAVDEVLDDLIRPVKQWQARQESKDLAKVCIRGLLSKLRARPGCWIVGTPPYGYDRKFMDRTGRFLFVARTTPNGTRQLLRQNGRSIRKLSPGERLAVAVGDHCRLTPGDPHHIAVVQRMFYECTRQKLGCEAIARRLNSEQIPTPREMGRAPRCCPGVWRFATIRTIMSNPAYAGDLAWNRCTAGTFYKIRNGVAVDKARSESRKFKRNRPEDWIVASDVHPPLVKRSIYEKAQALIQTRRMVRRGEVQDYHRPAIDFRARYVLAGLIKCACCGSDYRGQRCARFIRSRRSRPYRAQLYFCLHQCPPGRCVNGLIRQRVLEHAVADALVDWYEGYLAGPGRREIDAAARRWSLHVARVTGGPKGVEYARSAAQVWSESARAFIRDLRRHLHSPLPQDRFMAFRRCLGRIEIDAPRRRLRMWVRRLPILEARAGGLVRVTVKLPADLGTRSVRTWRWGRDDLMPHHLSEHLAGKPPALVDLVHEVRKVIMGLGPDVRETVRVAYVAYSLRRHFASVRVRHHKVLIYLKLTPKLIANPPAFMRDVTGIGTATTGRCELSLKDFDDLDQARPLIEEAYIGAEPPESGALSTVSE